MASLAAMTLAFTSSSCETVVDLGGSDPLDCRGGCVCGPGLACACNAGATCTQTCPGQECQVTCTSATCRFESGGWSSFACLADASCSGTLASGAVACADTSTCDFRASGSVIASCVEEASCALWLGPGSAITCASAAGCDVRCDGPCLVQCVGPCTCQGTECSVSCSGGGPGQICADGRTGCGTGC